MANDDSSFIPRKLETFSAFHHLWKSIRGAQSTVVDIWNKNIVAILDQILGHNHVKKNCGQLCEEQQI